MRNTFKDKSEIKLGIILIHRASASCVHLQSNVETLVAYHINRRPQNPEDRDLILIKR